MTVSQKRHWELLSLGFTFHTFVICFYFFVSHFQVPSASIEVSGVTNSSGMACVLSMRTICCTGAQRLVTFVVQVNVNLPLTMISK